MGTNSYVTKLKAQLNQAISQREHWKQLAENRNSIVVTEVCPESRSVEEYIIDADSVRASWRLIRGYREQIEALRAENGRLRESSRDVRSLAASLYQACGAYDMPERILDALSAAANGEPFAHMIDALLPCVPPSDQDVRGLVSADDVRDACANAVSVFAEETNAGQCREVAEYMREVLLAQIANRQAQRPA